MAKTLIFGALMCLAATSSFAGDLASYQSLVNASKAKALDLFIEWIKTPYRITRVDSMPLDATSKSVYTIIGFEEAGCSAERTMTVSIVPSENGEGYEYGFKFVPCDR